MKNNFQRLSMGILLVVVLAASISAVNLCTVAFFEDKKAQSKCFDIEENANGISVFERLTTLTLSANSSSGRKICKVDGQGTEVSGTSCQFSGNKWNIAKVEGDTWKILPIGLDSGTKCWNRDINFKGGADSAHYCAKDGDTIGLAFGEPGSLPDMLRIEDFKAFVEGRRVVNVNLTSTRINFNITPGAEVKFKVELENLYDGDTDIEITDIEVRVTIEDIDDGSNLKENIDSLDLNPEQSESVELLFTVPILVASGDYTVDVDITGQDDRKIKYIKDLSYKIVIDKERHQLYINSVKLDRTTYKCEKSALLDVDIFNIGEKNEDGTILVTNGPLELSLSETFDLDNDPFEDESKLSRKFTIPLKTDISSGTYDIEVEAHYASKIIAGKATLKKEDCAQGAIEKKETLPLEPEKVIEVPESTQSATSTKGASQESTKSEEPQNITRTTEPRDDYALIVAGLGLLAIFGVITVLALYLILNKKKD